MTYSSNRGPTADSVLIRDARPDELQEVSRVILEAYWEFAARIPSAVWARYAQDIQDVWSRLADSDLIVAERSGSLVGSVTFYSLAKRNDVSGWLDGWTGIRLLAVVPASRGAGVGRALVDECVARSRQEGAIAIGLHTTELMAVARAMYERMGFVRYPERDFNPGGRLTVKAYTFDLSIP